MPAKKQLGKQATDDAHIGIRPEHLVESTKATAVVQGTLELVENLGEYALVHLMTETGEPFIAKMDKPPKGKKGSVMSFKVDPALAHYFNKETEARL